MTGRRASPLRCLVFMAAALPDGAKLIIAPGYCGGVGEVLVEVGAWSDVSSPRAMKRVTPQSERQWNYMTEPRQPQPAHWNQQREPVPHGIGAALKRCFRYGSLEDK
jgi:hypothetical protein